MRLLSAMQRRSDAEAKALFKMQEIRELGDQVGIDKLKLSDIVESLNIQGFLLNKGQSKYQLVSANT